MSSTSPLPAPTDRALKRAQKESLVTLAGGTVHAINNVLTTILGYASLARRETIVASQLQGYVDEILKATNRAADLFHQLQAYTGRLHSERTRVDFSTFLHENLSTFEAILPNTVQFDTSVGENLAEVLGDTTQIRECVEKLLLNSVEALGKRKGKVSLRIHNRECDTDHWKQIDYAEDYSPGTYVCLEVTDDAGGMTPDVLARAFDPFYSTRLVGRGLGLAYVLGIAQNLGGVASIESTEGNGTTVRIYLPVTKKEES